LKYRCAGLLAVALAVALSSTLPEAREKLIEVFVQKYVSVQILPALAALALPAVMSAREAELPSAVLVLKPGKSEE